MVVIGRRSGRGELSSASPCDTTPRSGSPRRRRWTHSRGTSYGGGVRGARAGRCGGGSTSTCRRCGALSGAGALRRSATRRRGRTWAPIGRRPGAATGDTWASWPSTRSRVARLSTPRSHARRWRPSTSRGSARRRCPRTSWRRTRWRRTGASRGRTRRRCARSPRRRAGRRCAGAPWRRAAVRATRDPVGAPRTTSSRCSARGARPRCVRAARPPCRLVSRGPVQRGGSASSPRPRWCATPRRPWCRRARDRCAARSRCASRVSLANRRAIPRRPRGRTAACWTWRPPR
jgi:hypothetical protein